MDKELPFWVLVGLAAVPFALGPLVAILNLGASAPFALLASLAASALLAVLAAVTRRSLLIAIALTIPLIAHAALVPRPPPTDWDFYSVFVYENREFPIPRRAGFQKWVRSMPGRPVSIQIVVEPPEGWEGEVRVEWRLASGDEVLWMGEESITPSEPVSIVAEASPEVLEKLGQGVEAIVLDIWGEGRLPNGTTLFVADYRGVANVFYDQDGRIRLVQLKLPRGPIEPHAALPTPSELIGDWTVEWIGFAGSLVDVTGVAFAAGAVLYRAFRGRRR